MALTNTAIRNVSIDAKARKLSDGGGLYLFVSPAGGRLWRLNYRFDGRQKTLSFGPYPLVSLAEAREKRDAAKKLLLIGKDPAVEKKLQNQRDRASRDNTFGAVAEGYLDKQSREGKAAVTIKKNRWVLDFARAALWDRPVADVSSVEVLECLRVVERRGTLETARRMRSTIGAVFRFGIAEGKVADDPTIALRNALASPISKSQSAITDPKRFGELLRAVDAYQGQPATKVGLQLMALLFPRPGELRKAEWSEFDFERAIWTIPAARMKGRRAPAHRKPLSIQALEALASLHELTGRHDLVFPGNRTWKRPISENTLNSALRRIGFGQDEASSHGFRATASTLLNESGLWHEDAIERELSHLEGNEVRRAYARGEHWDERIRMMQWWADHLDNLRTG